MSRRACIAVAVAVLLVSARSAAGEPDPVPETPTPVEVAPAPPLITGWSRLKSGSHVVTDGGRDLRLPPGYFFDEPTWDVREKALKDLQNEKTRLTAENASFRKSAESWQPGWVTLAIATAGGLVGGWYLHSKI